ncbi:MAG TPA: SGNH/GDSL hydrolase family protein [Fodinibius sp.]|nr:SGNH/GDSL hydrolase family protein [Fodinibius sp.]
MDYTRRSFLQAISSAAIGALGGTLFAPAVNQEIQEDDFSVVPDDGTILFQGDSITDAGRNKKLRSANGGLGKGYAFLAAARLRQRLAQRRPDCYNRGISGNKVFQLADRWQEDTLALEPELLSILIGVNDFWHTLTGGYQGTVETYEQDFRSLLKQTKTQLPQVRLVIGEPFVVREGSAIGKEWFPDFRAYQKAAKKIARDFKAGFIPYQSVFDEASKEVKPTYWTADGVHPTLAGSQLMAEAWLQTVNRM